MVYYQDQETSKAEDVSECLVPPSEEFWRKETHIRGLFVWPTSTGEGAVEPQDLVKNVAEVLSSMHLTQDA